MSRKRDPELFKKILEAIEEADDEIYSEYLKIEGATQAQIDYHVQLLHDAEFIKLDGDKTFINDKYIIDRLTNRGHDFLEAARNETAWRKTIEKMGVAGGFVLKLAEPLLIEFFKQQLFQTPAP
jgi:hypothetical protein